MIAGWLTLAALAGTLEVSDRSELRLRYPGIQPGAASFDVETDPDALLTLASHTTTLRLEYAPQLVAWDLNIVGLEPSYLNRGTARAEWRARHLTLSLTEMAAYGSQSFASLALTPGADGAPARVDVFPAPRTFLYEASLTTLDARWNLPRWTLTASAGFQLAGGVTAQDRETLPYQSGPLGTLAGDYSLTRTDHLITSASGSYASFSTGVDGAIVQVDEAWRHGWSRLTSTLVRVGAAETGTRGISPSDTLESPAAPFQLATDPVAEGLIEHDFSGRRDAGDILFDAKLGPTLNPLIGLVDERIQGTLAGHYLHGRLGLRAQITLSESVPPTRLSAVRIFYQETAASYRLCQAVSVEVGTRTLWQDPTASAAVLAGAPANALYVPVPFLQEVVFLGLTLRADPVKF
jgi:hypothetical protein